eukprot:gnl/TRDRNA2_/TRDRNA2_98365_c1_seq1.p1 gnl/TRDRNA2_/TRDRNA2_98365_c1~~gnl/TRDRNA2_/TRDRNA2_98365_c1_seq1.p1  ORF type:complete len:350 (+),score=64.96 gnl/TRDRNA2_/TRDRNA2_98365_c1_seq1:43-1050(+)
MRVVRMMRLMKTFRVIRVVRFFKELKIMLSCVLNSIVPLTWALVLLGLIMYLFSVFCMQGATLYLRDNIRGMAVEMSRDSSEVAEGVLTELSPFEIRARLRDMYYPLPKALLTMLYSISGGNSWADAAAPLYNISPVYAVMFCVYIVFVVFGVLNVLTGIFVDSAMSIKDRDLVIQNEVDTNHRFLGDMRELFYEMNGDQSESVSWEELNRYFDDERVAAYFTAHDLDIADAGFIFKLIDVDESGTVTLDEFCLGCRRLKGPAKCLDVVHLLKDNMKVSKTLSTAVDALHMGLNKILLSLGEDQIPFAECSVSQTSSASRLSKFAAEISAGRGDS